jgi:hypothetical protein
MPGSNSGFQTFINRELPPGVAGDWAGANIRATVPVGPWALVAPPSGTTVGVFGWANPATGICSTYYQPSCFAGFIHREQQAQALQTSGASIAANSETMQILSGYPVIALAQGDFWGLFQGGCSVGNSVYVNPTTGALIAGASGAAVTLTGGSGTISSSGLLTLTVATSPESMAVGQVVSMAGVPPGTYITSLAGVGAIGTTAQLANLDGNAIPTVASATAFTVYGQQLVSWLCMDNVSAAASFTATLAAESGFGPFGLLTVSAVGSGTLVPGQWIQSSGTVPVPLTSNIQIVSQVSGTTGSTGTYLVSNTIAVGTGQTFTTYNGQLAKISSWT